MDSIRELLSKDFKEKQATLVNTKKQLKTEFVGLDNVIDEIISSVGPWYLFPDIQENDYSGQSMPVIPGESMPLYQRTNG